MRTKDDVLAQIAYHPATPEVAERYATMRALAAQVTEESWDLIPDGPEKTIAFRGLQQWLMFSNLAIALTTPADLRNPHIARVLPDDAPQA